MTRGGRPSKLTPAVQEKIITAIRAGNYAQVAAVYAGITERTYYRWMELGDQARGGRYLQFFQAVKAAEGEAEVRAVAIIQKKMTGDCGVSEVLYLRDPDGNGVELYWDRPAEQWPRTAEGGLAMYTRRLDVDDLLRDVDSELT